MFESRSGLAAVFEANRTRSMREPTDRRGINERTMKNIRLTLLVVGILAGLIGLVWIGQGTGYFPYPSSSFMINQMPWVYRGVVLAVLGLMAIVVSRRI